MVNYNRAEVVDQNFIKHVKENHLPAARSITTPLDAGLDQNNFWELFRSQLISRHLDLYSRILKEKNLSFYTIGSCGHEGNAAIARAFRVTDMAFLHYRSNAFMVERLKKIADTDPCYELMLSFVASAADPISGGRHKVCGSVKGFVPPQTSTIASHLPKAVGTAFSITLGKELALPTLLPADSVILCSFGDASINHSVAQGALNTAEWIHYGNIPLPLVWICEDNGIGISVPTPHDWVTNMMQHRQGYQYIVADGLNLADVFQKAQQAEYFARQLKKPVFLHMRCVRLTGHAGSDVEQHYKSDEWITTNEFQDPLLHSARIILENDFGTAADIIDAYQATAISVKQAAERALQTPRLTNKVQVMASLLPPKYPAHSVKPIAQALREKTFGAEYKNLSTPRNLCQNINYALTDLLLKHPNIVLFGEDVGKKGGVYRVTANLQERFGKRRVFDSLLDETSILGNAIGLAHNGFLPIPEIQFLAYYHNAEDQIRGEAATLSFFSNGQFTNPMILRIAGLAYQKGFGGHFHNDNSIAALRDVPGIIIACPARGDDAAKMLRECVRLALEDRRIIIFLEPIALYMTKDLQAGDEQWLSVYPSVDQKIGLGELGIYGESNVLAILTYGNGLYLSLQAQQIIANRFGIAIKVIDLRWLAPLAEAAICREIQACQNILIIDECRQTGSISEALVTLLVEKLAPLPMIKRINAADSFIPLGSAAETVLPSRDGIVDMLCDMLGISSKS
jgi:2-oxoisovalerate dehydrogenase E1 component